MLTRLLMVLALLIVVDVPALAQAPGEKPTPLSPDAYTRALERDNVGLQRQVLDRDYEALKRQLDERARALDAALAEEAAKAKLDGKAYRPDTASRTWRKVQQ
jgi:hypothetical protein